MPGHIFDANVLKNFTLSGHLALLPQLCSGPCYLPSSVYNELMATKRAFKVLANRVPSAEVVGINVVLQNLDASLQNAGLLRVNLLQTDRPDELAFWTCLHEEDRIDPGETECIALAVYRDLTIYSDDRAALLEVEAINSRTADCIRMVGDPRLPLTMHSSIWLLLKAAQEGLLTLTEASRAYEFMIDVLKSRLPRHPLASVMTDRSKYW